ncbi:SDR family NAD(P)-dependent oxidoreductase [Pseudanabaena yagii]|uniref:SDR family oxidoreductase n=1 Tax=Pseudanabaena yagii GIHE-NHR1 TaxID=2722753 RepID=A0ABX1LUU1_9CYAN|nr:SDR family NAD(P)-dependent oxidoreductase [Pseudanabaena yagii]NMF59275.1 SDR family oxidoreductase [Pseudanabaena yagii GIHE-NHR1]
MTKFHEFPQDFKGKVAIITGASSGIGQAVAEAIANYGAHTIFISRSGAEAITSQLNAAGKSALSLPCDVTDETQVKQAIASVFERYGRIDILINNAAINQIAKIEDISLEDWNRVIATNLTSLFLCCKYAVPIMKQQRSGNIINVSSIAGHFRSKISGIHYVASKAGVVGFTRQLAYELAPFQINVNAICPSQTYTPMLAATLPPEAEQKLIDSIPLGRIASMEEQVNVILFLASHLSSYMTGAIVDVNGGQF